MTYLIANFIAIAAVIALGVCLESIASGWAGTREIRKELDK